MVVNLVIKCFTNKFIRFGFNRRGSNRSTLILRINAY